MTSPQRTLVSVITATYNRARFLPGAMHSVRAQELREWEHIIIDDGSTDDTLEIVHPATRDPRVKYKKTANRGQAAALNLGLEIAQAGVVAFLDSDDEFLPNHLSRLLHELRSDDLDFVLGSFELVVSGGDPDPKVTDFYQRDRLIPVREIECITGVLFGDREAFLRVGGFRDVPFTDTDLLARMKEAGYRWKRVTEPTYRYYFGRAPNSQALEQTRRESES